jgi:hypothetical protein
MDVSITAVGPVGCGDTFTWDQGESGKSAAGAGGGVCCVAGGVDSCAPAEKAKAADAIAIAAK